MLAHEGQGELRNLSSSTWCLVVCIEVSDYSDGFGNSHEMITHLEVIKKETTGGQHSLMDGYGKEEKKKAEKRLACLCM